MKFHLSALIVLALAISQTSALPKPVALSYSQKYALVIAYRMGDHYSLGLTFAAIVYVESSACQHLTGDRGLAHGCSQLHLQAAKTASGTDIPAWQLADPNLQDENMAIGARDLDLCMQRFGWPAGIGCYQIGMPAASHLTRRALAHTAYTLSVVAAMKWLREIPLSED